MRIRSIRPEFWASEDIAALDWRTRLIFIGLWSYVDDNGVGRDVAKLIKADLLPLEDDPHEALMHVAGALMRLESGGQVCRYRVDGKPYLHICAWSAHQVIGRPSKSRYPRLTCENVAENPSAHVIDMSPHVIPSLGEGEKGRRGEGEKGKNPSSEVAHAPTDPATRPDVDRLCQHLAQRIQDNTGNPPNTGKRWRDAARLLIDRDGRTEDQIHACIDWCQDDEFWRTNILSMPKLREKYDQLRLKAMQRNNGRPNGNGAVDLDAAMRRAAERDGVA